MPPVDVTQRSRAFSLLELLICAAIIAVLLGILLPMLVQARRVGYAVVCGSNLRQVGVAWQSYVQENKERFPRYGDFPDWSYGGAVFVGADRRAELDSHRPINRYIDAGQDPSADSAMLFRCPADRGVYVRGSAVRGQPGASTLEYATCFQTYGTSYRANPLLLDTSRAGISGEVRALRLPEILVDHSRLLLTGDPAWTYGTAAPGSGDAGLEASWHGKRDAGNMLAVDGSTRFIDFSRGVGGEFVLSPRP